MADTLARFLEYAAAFEKVVETDDWSGLEPYFAEDSVYHVSGPPPFAGRHEGRESVFAALKASLDNLDRRFETRQVDMLEGPELRNGGVWFRWRASYRSPGLPELVIDGEESVVFEGSQIQELKDHLEPQMGGIAESWIQHYGAMLPAPP